MSRYGRSTHSQQLERYLGLDKIAQLSEAMRDWYGPPIALHGVPGKVWAARGGDFVGPIAAGYEASKYERAEDILRREARARFKLRMFRQLGMAGFSSLSDLIAEATTGKRREYAFQKVGTTGVVNATNSLWRVGNLPPAGAVASNAPGGDALTDASTGAFPIDNVSADTRHFVAAAVTASVAANSLLMYDRIFQVNKTMSSSATESVTGVPTRYQSSTATADDYAGGSFAFVETQVALSNTAHNWTVCQYRNQAGTDAQSFPSLTGNNSNIANRLDHPVAQWFMPLNASDTGVMDLAQMQCSSASVTGTIAFVIGHPLAWMPCPVANLICFIDGINTAFNLVRIFDDAAMAFLEVNKPATGATTYTGTFTAVHG